MGGRTPWPGEPGCGEPGCGELGCGVLGRGDLGRELAERRWALDELLRVLVDPRRVPVGLRRAPEEADRFVAPERAVECLDALDRLGAAEREPARLEAPVAERF